MFTYHIEILYFFFHTTKKILQKSVEQLFEVCLGELLRSNNRL